MKLLFIYFFKKKISFDSRLQKNNTCMHDQTFEENLMFVLKKSTEYILTSVSLKEHHQQTPEQGGQTTGVYFKFHFPGAVFTMSHVGELWHFVSSSSLPILPRVPGSRPSLTIHVTLSSTCARHAASEMSRNLITFPLFYQSVFSSVCQTLGPVCRHLKQRTLALLPLFFFVF